MVRGGGGRKETNAWWCGDKVVVVVGVMEMRTGRERNVLQG